MELWTREARLFKYGSGTGTNFSNLRGENEPLSGGGKSSGLMSFLKIGDRAAGAIKSGGTTRRAAKMVCLNLDHPDIEQFINWKVREELKVAALAEGIKRLSKDQMELAAKLGLKLDYDFNGEGYLTVSGQLEAEIFACSLGKVYTFGPTFRAENSNTSRHLAEFWMVEPEVAYATLDDLMDLA